MKLEFKRKVQVAEICQGQEEAPSSDRADSLHGPRSLKDHRCSGEGHKDERFGRQSQKVRSSLGDTWHCKQEPDEDLLEGLYHRQREKTTFMQSASALSHSEQVHHEETKSFSKLKAMVADVWEDQH